MSEAHERKFSSRLPFDHRPPYAPLFAERIPVLQAFQAALGNFLQVRRHGSWKDWRRWVPGAWSPFMAVECGVYMGNSLLACASMAQDAGIPFQLIGLDTFSGLPPLSGKDRSLAPEGAGYLTNPIFSDTTYEAVQQKIVTAGLDGRVRLLKGLFRETLTLLPESGYHFVNIDCDLYDPHLECLEYFYPRMVRGGIVFFDDYYSVEFPMARAAVNDFMRDKPEQLLHLRFGGEAPNGMKSYFVKY